MNILDALDDPKVFGGSIFLGSRVRNDFRTTQRQLSVR
jgi:hypothetical protein